MTPAQRHKRRIEAREAAENAATGATAPVGDKYRVQLMALAADKRRLKNIRSGEVRRAKKAELYRKWLPYIDGVLATDAGVPDQIIAHMLVWAFDAGDTDRALTIGRYMLDHALPAPEQFVRDTPSIVAEMAAEAWLDHDPHQITQMQLETVTSLTAGCDMLDEIRAKLYRALGEACIEQGGQTAAREHLARAVALNPRVGCKPLLRSVEKALENPH